MKRTMCAGLWLFAGVCAAFGQSSSLYVAEPVAPARVDGRVADPRIDAASYTAVLTPEPRRFAVHDLVTIIIREQTSVRSKAALDTEKETRLDARVDAFPRLTLTDLLNAQVRPGGEDGPRADVKVRNEFDGEGDYERSDTMTTRLTARVIDVKPNGTLALEARTFMQNDDEKSTITVTGSARPDDVTADNTVLSTQLFDLRVAKTHTGELRNASRKGLLTKLLDLIFNF